MLDCPYLVIAHYRGDDSSSKTGGDADADATNRTANSDVPNHVVLSIPDGRRGERGREGGKEEGKTDFGPK